MAHSVSAWKRVRQNRSRYLRNRSVMSDLRTRIKTLGEIVTRNEADKARPYFRSVLSRIDKARKNDIIHNNKAARLKSKLALLMNRLNAPPKATAESAS